MGILYPTAKPPRVPSPCVKTGNNPSHPPLDSWSPSWRPLDQQYWARLVWLHLLNSLGSPPPDAVLIAATCRPRHGDDLRRRPGR